MRTAFLNEITNLMRKHKDIIVITADMGFSVFEGLQKEFPNRFMNTGITEQSSIGIATGLALSGYTVYFYAQAQFATMRCFEQVRLDVAFHNLNVKIIGVASGFSTNQLGVSHYAIEDVALMRLLPNMTVLTPGDPYESSELTRLSYETAGPVYIRINKSGTPLVHNNKKPAIVIGKGLKIRAGKGCSLLVSGSLLPVAVAAADMLSEQGIQTSVISFHTVKPLDKALILQEARFTKNIFTLEDHFITGGFGSAVAEVLAEANSTARFLRLGVPDRFTSVVGSQEYLLAENGLSKEEIVKTIVQHLKHKL